MFSLNKSVIKLIIFSEKNDHRNDLLMITAKKSQPPIYCTTRWKHVLLKLYCKLDIYKGFNHNYINKVLFNYLYLLNFRLTNIYGKLIT